jgi:nucleoside-diphosphate-sugar epimerase
LDKKKLKPSILIVGGTGFIGYHLACKFLNKGWSVTIFSQKKPKKLRMLSKVKYLRGNIFIKSSLKKINRYYDHVINCGGYVDHKSKIKVYKSHFIGCKNLVDLFLKKNIKNFIQIGSSAEYGRLNSPHSEKLNCEPKSFYGMAKLKATKYLLTKHKKNNFPCTIVRLYQVFGTNQDNNRLIPFVINSCLSGKYFPCTDGNQFRDFISIQDLVSLIEKILRTNKTNGHVLNVASGKAIKIRWLINFIRKKIKNGKPEFGKIKMRTEENKKVYPSIKKAKLLLNWKPKLNFKNEIINQILYYKKLTK